MAIRDSIKKFQKAIFNRGTKNVVDSELQQKIFNYTKDKIEQTVEDQYYGLLSSKIFGDVNDQIQKFSQFDYSRYIQQRLSRYMEYELIQQKIPEQNNQVKLVYDLVINPEIYTSEFINFDMNTEEQIQEFEFKKDNDGLLQKINVNLQDYLSIYARRNKIYPIIKQAIHNQLFYGDGFIEISDPILSNKDEQNITSKKLNKDLFVSNYLTYNSLSPKQVLILQLDNVCLGYLVLPKDINNELLDETRLSLDFLTFLLKELDVEKFKNFTNIQVFKESVDNQDIMFESIMDLNGQSNKSTAKQFDDIRSVLLNDSFQRANFQELLKEQTVNSQMLKDKFTLQFQIDLNPYMGNKTQSGEDKRIEQLMDIDPNYGSILKNRMVRYILPDHIQHFTLTDYKYYPYGQGLLDSVRSIQSLILLLEYQMIIYRLTKQPDRKKYVVDVTGIQKEKIPEYVNRIKNELKSQKTIDVNGTLQENLDLITLMEDYFILKKNGNELLNIENVEGQQMQQWYDDMKYWHDKLLSSLKIPPSYLGYNENLSGQQTVLTLQDHRMQRQIIHLQQDLNEGINQLFLNSFNILSTINNKRTTYLVDKTIKDMLNQEEIVCKLFQPVQLEQKERQETISQRLDLIRSINEMTGFSVENLLNYFKVFTSTELQNFKETIETKEDEEEKE